MRPDFKVQANFLGDGRRAGEGRGGGWKEGNHY